MVRVILAACLLACCLTTPHLSSAGDLYENQHLRIWGSEVVSGGITYVSVCAKSTTHRSIANVSADLVFRDSFGTVLVRRRVQLYYDDRPQALCHQQAIPAQARDTWKWGVERVGYVLGQ